MSADDEAATVRDADGTECRVEYTQIDKARVVFDFDTAKKANTSSAATAPSDNEIESQIDKENQPS